MFRQKSNDNEFGASEQDIDDLFTEFSGKIKWTADLDDLFRNFSEKCDWQWVWGRADLDDLLPDSWIRKNSDDNEFVGEQLLRWFAPWFFPEKSNWQCVAPRMFRKNSDWQIWVGAEQDLDDLLPEIFRRNPILTIEFGRFVTGDISGKLPIDHNNESYEEFFFKSMLKSDNKNSE